MSAAECTRLRIAEAHPNPYLRELALSRWQESKLLLRIGSVVVGYFLNLAASDMPTLRCGSND
eukprot:6196900-Pleurochrysis_carterae.AAC.1